VKTHPDGAEGSFRIFHPAFPQELLTPISHAEAESITKVQKSIASPENYEYSIKQLLNKGLPWNVLPSIGVFDLQKVMSKTELKQAYEATRNFGVLVWAHKLPMVEPGCVILNHWKQEVIFISEYSSSDGAVGYKLAPSRTVLEGEKMVWGPLTLELELVERKWQPVAVSDNILNEILTSYLPQEMPAALWELILLCLVSKEDKSVLQALIETGLSPRRGLIAYIRLLKAVEARAEAWNDIPSYRLILEQDVL